MKDTARIAHKEEESKTRPFLEIEEIQKYLRGDFPYFYNQSRLTKSQIDNAHFNTQFKSQRDRQKDDFIKK